MAKFSHPVDDCPLAEIENGVLRRTIEKHVAKRGIRNEPHVSTIVTEVFIGLYAGSSGHPPEEHIEAAVASYVGIAS